MEMAFSEVRFLDVDFEQLEKEYDDMIREMGNEIEEEKVLDNAAKQLNHEVNRLQENMKKAEKTPPSAEVEAALHNVRQTTIPALRTKLETMKQQNEQARQSRKNVMR